MGFLGRDTRAASLSTANSPSGSPLMNGAGFIVLAFAAVELLFGVLQFLPVQDKKPAGASQMGASRC